MVLTGPASVPGPLAQWVAGWLLGSQQPAPPPSYPPMPPQLCLYLTYNHLEHPSLSLCSPSTGVALTKRCFDPFPRPGNHVVIPLPPSLHITCKDPLLHPPSLQPMASVLSHHSEAEEDIYLASEMSTASSASLSTKGNNIHMADLEPMVAWLKRRCR